MHVLPYLQYDILVMLDLNCIIKNDRIVTILLIERFTFWFKKNNSTYSFEIVVFSNNFCHIYGHVDLGHMGLWNEMNLRMKHAPELAQSLNLLVYNHPTHSLEW